VFRNHCFARKVKGHQLLKCVTEAEVRLLVKCLSYSKVVVDVAIDLQGLPRPDHPKYVWELTKRPVDYAFKALSPLAERIGSYISRFLYLYESLPDNPLGKTLFETYPAASLLLMSLPTTKYKGRAIFQEHGEWHGCQDDDERQIATNNRLAKLLNKLGWTAQPTEIISHDEFDAGICAVTGVVNTPDLLAEQMLRDEISSRIADKQSRKKRSQTKSNLFDGHIDPPRGYVLLRKCPQSVRIVTHEPAVDETNLQSLLVADYNTTD
jgi:hypothetical protein